MTQLFAVLLGVAREDSERPLEPGLAALFSRHDGGDDGDDGAQRLVSFRSVR